MPRTQADQALFEAERHVARSEFQQALEALGRARYFFQKACDRDGEAMALMRRGELDLRQGRTTRARDAFLEALGLFTADADDSDRAAAEVLLSEALHLLGETHAAREHASVALTRAAAAGNLFAEARVHMQLGRMDLDDGRSDRALESLGHARRLYEEAGHGLHEATALSAMATVLREAGRLDDAHTALERAAELFTMNGDHLDEAATRLDIGRVLKAMGAMEDARQAFTQAVRLNGEAGNLVGEAEALLEAGRLEARSAPKRALKLLRHAAELFGHAGLDGRRAQVEQEVTAIGV